jgi:uncharacterized ion transporter superfamily protein YfcC
MNRHQEDEAITEFRSAMSEVKTLVKNDKVASIGLIVVLLAMIVVVGAVMAGLWFLTIAGFYILTALIAALGLGCIIDALTGEGLAARSRVRMFLVGALTVASVFAFLWWLR